MIKTRFSNFEIMRIVAIFLIVSFHCSFHSGFTYDTFSDNVLVIKTFWLFGELGVNLFFLVSGFFQINGKMKPKKVILLFAQLFFYIFVSAIIKSFITNDFSLIRLRLIKSLLIPEYWFFSAYILLYIFSPFINSFIKHLSKLQLATFLLLSYIIYSVSPTIIGILDGGGTEGYFYFTRFLWGFIMYSTGAYISTYKDISKCSVRKNVLVMVCSFAVMIFFIVLVGNVSFPKIELKEPAFFWQINTIPMLMLSISVFNLFRFVNVKSLKIINIISSTTLGIYLLSDGTLRNVIWDSIFDVKNHLNYSAIHSLIYIVSVSLIVIIVGVCVDLIRQEIECYTIVKVLNHINFDKIKNNLYKFVKTLFY